MEKISDTEKSNRQKVPVNERELIVAPGKSKKLAAMANKLQPVVLVEDLPLPETDAVSALKPEIARELTLARKIIIDSINAIMDSYPAGKRNKLFSVRFGSVDAIKAMNIKAAFKVLGIDHKRVNMRLIAGLDFYGNDAEDSK